MSTIENSIKNSINETVNSYDLIVIGGGSGGIAASKEASKLGAKVALFDFVKPSTQNTTWKLGGTCVNVGCIPKKLYHTSSIYSDHIKDSLVYGWKILPEDFEENKTNYLDWETLKDSVQSHIHSLNFKYPTDLKKNGVAYFNELVTFVDKNTIETIDKKGEKRKYRAKFFVIATGGRPYIPDDVKGAKEFAITSDDIFSLVNAPGKTLCIGASYISLECAGFLRGLGFDVTVMVRSIILRGFDQECSNKIKENMDEMGVKFLAPNSPVSIEKLENKKLKIEYINNDTKEKFVEEFDTILFATGRRADTKKLNIENLGVKFNNEGKIIVNDVEQSSCDNIYGIGDCANTGLELQPIAVLSGKLLARRLFGNSTKKMNYNLVPTTVFTPLEYGSCGFSEEKAIEKYQKENLVIYKKEIEFLEYAAAEREEKGFVKLICLKNENEKVIGFHYLGPNAGEVTQGFALSMKLGATKEDFDDCCSIHPTNAEKLLTLEIGVEKSSGC